MALKGLQRLPTLDSDEEAEEQLLEQDETKELLKKLKELPRETVDKIASELLQVFFNNSHYINQNSIQDCAI
jgi:hypothetical protein